MKLFKSQLPLITLLAVVIFGLVLELNVFAKAPSLGNVISTVVPCTNDTMSSLPCKDMINQIATVLTLSIGFIVVAAIASNLIGHHRIITRRLRMLLLLSGVACLLVGSLTVAYGYTHPATYTLPESMCPSEPNLIPECGPDWNPIVMSEFTGPDPIWKVGVGIGLGGMSLGILSGMLHRQQKRGKTPRSATRQ